MATSQGLRSRIMSNPSDNTRADHDGTRRNSPLPPDAEKPTERIGDLHDLASGSANSSNEPTRAYVPDAAGSNFNITDSQPMPKKLGKYEISKRLGRGGMGVVWKAVDPDLHRTVAIKVLSPELAHSSVARRRFRREAQAVAAISHPNVLTIHSVEAEGETPYIVMEFVDGESLREYVDQQGTLPPLEVVRLGTQIAMGLAAAHANGVIHRDVKPANVMLHKEATRLRLMDFGLARVAFDNVDLTSHDHCVGTPAYMAPEQVRGQEIDGRADLFSLGCVLYYMMTGISPFQGKSPAETIHRILAVDPPPLDQAVTGAAPVLAEIIDKLLKKDPNERYQSAQEVADIFKTLLTQLNLARTDHLADVLSDRNLARTALETDKRRPARSMVAFAAFALLLVVGAYALKQYSSRTLESPQSREVAASPTTSRDPQTTLGSTDRFEAAAVQPKLQLITVGPGGNCQTIAEAVERAAEDCEIVVVGPGPFTESITIKGDGLRGMKLRAAPRARWACPAGTGDELHALRIQDVSGVEISGFDFDVAPEAGRGINVTGRVGHLRITDCQFQHRPLRADQAYKLSLVNVSAERKDADAILTIRDSRFSGANGLGFCLAVDAKELKSPQVDCRDCIFRSENKHVLIAKSCSRLTLANNVFVGGHTGLHFSFKEWLGEEQFLIHNNTFAETRFWMSWMDSLPSATAVPPADRTRVWNNLILGGERTMGKPEQWKASIGNWSFAANWWERDATTQPTADREGQIATLYDRLDVPERRDPQSPNFLVPAEGSELLTSGTGGDLPTYIGAKKRLD